VSLNIISHVLSMEVLYEYMHGLIADGIYGPKPKKKAQLEAFLK